MSFPPLTCLQGVLFCLSIHWCHNATEHHGTKRSRYQGLTGRPTPLLLFLWGGGGLFCGFEKWFGALIGEFIYFELSP